MEVSQDGQQRWTETSICGAMLRRHNETEFAREMNELLCENEEWVRALSSCSHIFLSCLVHDSSFGRWTKGQHTISTWRFSYSSCTFHRTQTNMQEVQRAYRTLMTVRYVDIRFAFILSFQDLEHINTPTNTGTSRTGGRRRGGGGGGRGSG